MTVFWIIVGSMLLVVVVGTVLDLFRMPWSGAAKAGWTLILLLLPFIGAAIYWIVRKPTEVDPEQQYLLEAEQRHEAARRPFDSTGLRR